MSQTVLQARDRTVVIGPEQPFVMIGERINPTNRKRLSAEMTEGDFSRVESEAVAQVEAGARMLDINAGIPLADEPALLAEAVRKVQAVVDVPLSIDSSVVDALAAGLEVYEGRPLVNSVTAEEERLESVLPLVKKYDAAVVGICNDEDGISEDPEVRIAAARKIIERAQDHGIDPKDVIIDPLAMPIGAMESAGTSLFEIVRRCTDELDVNTICGASNISFGLPNRAALNATFLAMAITIGMPCAITNPLDHEIRQSVLAADVLMGRDPNCERWLLEHRKNSGRGAGRSRRRRRRRAASGS